MLASPLMAIDQEHREKGEKIAAAAIEYLRSQQDTQTGGWNVNPDGPDYPAITGLVVIGMAMNDDVPDYDPTLEKAADYILSFRQSDGGIYDQILPSYNTAICLSALARLGTPQAKEAIPPAQTMIRALQYWEGAEAEKTGGETMAVARSHPFYGGIGYGGHGRPDASNLHMAMQAMQDSGVPADDPFVKRAVVFLERIQMHDHINDMAYADGSSQGGFIYSTSPEKDQVGVGESKAGMIEETLDDGTNVSRLRAYGSMTYAGFKGYLYADLPQDDPRVEAARDWIESHYTLEENPGVGMQGFYYYMVTFSRALEASGLSTVSAHAPGNHDASTHDWRNELIDRLADLQKDDGSFTVLHDRWMENNPVLITAYALIAVEHALEE